MRTLLLSLKPSVYESIVSGEKIYEHRRVFPNEPVEAYIYISRPVQALAGIMHLDNKVFLEDWKKQYAYDSDAVQRIDNYLEHHKVAMEIRLFQDTNRIPLSEIRQKFPDFLIPQMYYYLDNTELLEYLKENLKPLGEPVEHSFDNVTSNMICIH